MSVSIIELMPNEVLTEIFERINVRDFKSISRVCKKFYEVAVSYRSGRNLFSTFYKNLADVNLFFNKFLKTTEDMKVSVYISNDFILDLIYCGINRIDIINNHGKMVFNNFTYFITSAYTNFYEEHKTAVEKSIIRTIHLDHAENYKYLKMLIKNAIDKNVFSLAKFAFDIFCENYFRVDIDNLEFLTTMIKFMSHFTNFEKTPLFKKTFNKFKFLAILLGYTEPICKNNKSMESFIDMLLSNQINSPMMGYEISAAGDAAAANDTGYVDADEADDADDADDADADDADADEAEDSDAESDADSDDNNITGIDQDNNSETTEMFDHMYIDDKNTTIIEGFHMLIYNEYMYETNKWMERTRIMADIVDVALNNNLVNQYTDYRNKLLMINDTKSIIKIINKCIKSIIPFYKENEIMNMFYISIKIYQIHSALESSITNHPREKLANLYDCVIRSAFDKHNVYLIKEISNALINYDVYSENELKRQFYYCYVKNANIKNVEILVNFIDEDDKYYSLINLCNKMHKTENFCSCSSADITPGHRMIHYLLARDNPDKEMCLRIVTSLIGAKKFPMCHELFKRSKILTGRNELVVYFMKHVFSNAILYDNFREMIKIYNEHINTVFIIFTLCYLRFIKHGANQSDHEYDEVMMRIFNMFVYHLNQKSDIDWFKVISYICQFDGNNVNEEFNEKVLQLLADYGIKAHCPKCFRESTEDHNARVSKIRKVC